MKLGTILLLSSLAMGALTGCDSPGFKSKAKTAANAKAVPQASQTEVTSFDLQGGATPLANQTPAVWAPNLTVSDAIAKACGIAPRGGDGKQMQASFDFDSAALQDEDKQLLAEVAKCLTDGALRGRNVTLIGRADARGEAEYNMTLGESRANAVNRYLVDLGVGRDKMKSTSRGEMDATGTNEEGWRKDRRVDIELML